MGTTVREEDGEDDEHFELGHTEWVWRGQRPLSSHNKGNLLVRSVESYRATRQGTTVRPALLEQRSLGLLGPGSTVLSLSWLSHLFLPLYFCPSLTGQCMLPANPFPPLPVISNYISVLPWESCLFFKQIFQNLVVPRVYFLLKQSPQESLLIPPNIAKASIF